MREYDIITEVQHPEEIIKQYHYTTALDTFIITITKEDRQPRWYHAEDNTPNPVREHEPVYEYQCYVSRLNYGKIHFVVGIMEEDIEILKEEAIDYIQHLEKEIAEGETDC